MGDQNKSDNYILEMRNITKRFPGTSALNEVSFNLRKGEVHALVGENGAGKSTLIKILTGVYQPDSGEIILNGQGLRHINPAHSLRLGIHFVYQEPTLFSLTSVLENLFLVDETFYKRGIVQKEKATKRALAVFKELNLHINLSQFVYKLTRGEKQMISIARAMISSPKILVLDEPTAPLTRNEIEALFKTIKVLRSQGVSIIYISHRLEEIFEIADRITVIRNGKNVGFHSIKNIDLDTLIMEIVATSIKKKFPKEKFAIGKEIISVRGLSSNNDFRDISFEIHEGEIFGVAGVVGSGKAALGQVLFGLMPKTKGEIFVNGKKLEIKSSQDAIREGIVLVPEDRRAHGVISLMSVQDNITVPNVDRFSTIGGWIQRNQTRKVSLDYVKRLSIQTPSINQLIQFLSGGNQQKVVIAKWLCSKAKVFIFIELTAGIDVGSKIEIYRLLNEICRDGGCVLMISSEFEELLGMCDRIMVLYQGHIITEKDAKDLNTQSILRYAVGGDNRKVEETEAVVKGGKNGSE